MSYIGQTRPIKIVTYPLNSIIGPGGAPRFGMVERDQGVIIESDRITPLDIGDVHIQSKLPIPGNVLSPGLPFYLRNSLLDLDTYQTKAGELQSEADLQALQEELAVAQKEQERVASEQEKLMESKLGKWEYMTLGGVGLVTTALIYYFLKK